MKRLLVRRATTTVLATLACVMLFFTVFFTCIQWVAFNENRYATAQRQLALADKAGISEQDRARIMHELLLYCQGERKSLNMQATIDGQTREVFSQREKDHMVDVQKLFVRGMRLRTILVIAFFFFLLLLIYGARKQTLRELARGWLITVAVLGVLLIALGIYFTVDFDGAWTNFHHVFFTNDLWLLYENDMLILLLMPLFDGIVRAIILSAGAVFAVLTAAAVVGVKLLKRPELAEEEPEDIDDDTVD